RQERLPLEIYASLVDWLYDGAFTLLAGGVAASIAILLTAWKTQYWPLWLCAAGFALVTALRAIEILAYGRAKTPRSPEAPGRSREIMQRWELRYAVGTGIHHAILGLWSFVCIALTTDFVIHTICATVVVAYAATGAGRNCGRPYIVMLQFVAAIGFYILGL